MKRPDRILSVRSFFVAGSIAAQCIVLGLIAVEDFRHVVSSMVLRVKAKAAKASQYSGPTILCPQADRSYHVRPLVWTSHATASPAAGSRLGFPANHRRRDDC